MKRTLLDRLPIFALGAGMLSAVVPHALLAQTETTLTGDVALYSADPISDQGTRLAAIFRVWGSANSTCVPTFKEISVEDDVIVIDTWWPFAAPCVLMDTDYEFQTPPIELDPGVYTVWVWNDSPIVGRTIPVFAGQSFTLTTVPDPAVDVEPFRISIEGEWSDGCVPGPGDIQQIDERALLVRGLGMACDLGCVASITPYSFETEPFGPLAAGNWSVEYRVVRCDGEVTVGTTEIEVVPALGLPGCIEASDVLCIDGRAESDRRFQVEIEWQTERLGGASGRGTVVRPSDAPLDGGLFWFFAQANPEVMVKALDGCGVNRHWWVFVSALTDVGYVLTVTDTETGEEWTSSNDDQVLALPVADTEAFACQPPFS